MNNQLWGMLNASEQQLVRDTEASALAGLDEDRLAELHDRVRRARNKYTKLYRRRARAQVGSDASRARAHAQHARTAAKAEVFEDVLARVSRQLAKAARASAQELRSERLAAARRSSSARPKANKAKPRETTTAASRRANTKRKTPATKRARASTRATTARKQAKRDSR
jgi:phage-related minor tail protein